MILLVLCPLVWIASSSCANLPSFATFLQSASEKFGPDVLPESISNNSDANNESVYDLTSNLKNIIQQFMVRKEISSRYLIFYQEFDEGARKRILISLESNFGVVFELNSKVTTPLPLGQLNFLFYGCKVDCNQVYNQEFPSNGIIIWTNTSLIWPNIHNLVLRSEPPTGYLIDELAFFDGYQKRQLEIRYVPYGIIGFCGSCDFILTKNNIEFSHLFEGIRICTSKICSDSPLEKYYCYRKYSIQGQSNIWKIRDFVLIILSDSEDKILISWKEKAFLKIRLGVSEIQDAVTVHLDATDHALKIFWSWKRIEIENDSLHFEEIIDCITSA